VKYGTFEGEVDIPITSMPGRYMLGWRHGLIEEVSDDSI